MIWYRERRWAHRLSRLPRWLQPEPEGERWPLWKVLAYRPLYALRYPVARWAARRAGGADLDWARQQVTIQGVTFTEEALSHLRDRLASRDLAIRCAMFLEHSIASREAREAAYRELRDRVLYGDGHDRLEYLEDGTTWSLPPGYAPPWIRRETSRMTITDALGIMSRISTSGLAKAPGTDSLGKPLHPEIVARARYLCTLADHYALATYGVREEDLRVKP